MATTTPTHAKQLAQAFFAGCFLCVAPEVVRVAVRAFRPCVIVTQSSKNASTLTETTLLSPYSSTDTNLLDAVQTVERAVIRRDDVNIVYYERMWHSWFPFQRASRQLTLDMFDRVDTTVTQLRVKEEVSYKEEK